LLLINSGPCSLISLSAAVRENFNVSFVYFVQYSVQRSMSPGQKPESVNVDHAHPLSCLTPGIRGSGAVRSCQVFTVNCFQFCSHGRKELLCEK